MMRRVPRVAAVGMASWDRILVVQQYPVVGAYEIVRHELDLPGGTTTNTSVALARMGAEVSLAAMTGDDPNGVRLRESLLAEPGIDNAWVQKRSGEPTDASTIIASIDPPERTIFWHRGAQIRRGDKLDLTAIFDHDLVLLDVADASLRRWLTDLPAHFAPRTRLLGTLTYVAGTDEPDNLDVALRHDVIAGSERETLLLTGTGTADEATRFIQSAMPGANLRAWIISRGATGCRIITPDAAMDIAGFSVQVQDVTGAGDAFAAGVAYGGARRWDWTRTGRLANAAGALATRAIGAQASLPTRAEITALLGEEESTLFS
jgi:sugar/nucleoside kinase (ribokinase family)